MATVGSNQLRVPASSDAPDGPGAFYNLGLDIDGRFGAGGAESVANTTALAAIPTARCFNGKTAYVVANGTYYRYFSGSGWRAWSSAWTTYSPTTGYAIGNFGDGSSGAATPSVSSWKWRYVDGDVRVRGYVQLGTSGGCYGNVTVALPVNADTGLDVTLSVAKFVHASGTPVRGIVALASSSSASIITQNVAGTYPADAALSSTVPFTWASGDVLQADFTYLAA